MADTGDNYDGWDTDLLGDYIDQAFPEGLEDVKPEQDQEEDDA